MSLLGAYLVLTRRIVPFIKNINAYVLLVWWFISIGMLVLFALIPWSQIGQSDIRFRGMEFSYFGIVPMAAIGIQKLNDILKGRLHTFNFKKLALQFASIAVIVVIAVPTISIGWPRYYYDNPPPVDMHNLNPVEAYYGSSWLSTYSFSPWVAGTQDGEIWVSGNAAKLFYYAAFNDTLVTHTINSDIYYINLANVLIPDQSALTIGRENITWLNSELSQVYDNGKIVILSSNNGAQ